MAFKSMFIEKFCVIFVFLLFKLSFRTSIEVSMICVPFKHFFPNNVFDFLIRLSCSYTLLSLDIFSNVTQCRKWLFFTPFAIVFFELDWDKDLPLVCFIVKESPFFAAVVCLYHMLFCDLQSFSAAPNNNVSS